MKKETVKTRNQYNMFEISSLIQKSIRRRHAEFAYFAANELIPHYRNYLWKRLLTVSAEDCFDMLTGKIMDLHEKDCNREDAANRKYIACAVSVLLNARKNRDADFFACNLLNSRDRKDIDKYVEDPIEDVSCSTKNGHCMFDVANCFMQAIEVLDDEMAGYALNELLVRYRKFSWKTMILKAKEFGLQEVVDEIRALKSADEQTKGCSSIFHAKAATILLKVKKYGNTNFYKKNFPYNSNIDLSVYDNKHYTIPEYVFDCHTYIGKVKKRTKEMFVMEEENALTPHQQGEYDSSTWEHYFWLCKNGFWLEEKCTPRPQKSKIKELETGTVQLNLFGE